MASKQKKQAPAKAAKSGGDLSAKLSKLKNNWNEAADNPIGDFKGWEDGQYNATLTEAELCESAGGRLQVKWGFKNNEDPEANTHFMFDGMDTEAAPQCLAYLRKHIEQMGYQPPSDLNKIQALLEEMVQGAPQVVLQVKTKGEYTNTYIKNLIEE